MGESLTEQYRVEEKEDLWVDLKKSRRALQPTEQNVDFRRGERSLLFEFDFKLRLKSTKDLSNYLLK